MSDFDEDPKPGDVEIMLSHGASNQPPGRQVHLEITERISRQRIVDVRLTPEQLGTLLGSSSVYAPADLPTHPERIGKRMEVDTQHVGYITGGPGSVDAEAEGIAECYREAGWDSVSVGRTNKGRNVTARRWVEP